MFICKNPNTNQKARQFPLRYCIQKARNFHFRDFDEIFEVGNIYKKHDTLRYVTFYIRKAGNFAKIKTICVTFLYTKSGHAALRDFY